MTGSGAVDEADFQKAFDETSTVQVSGLSLVDNLACGVCSMSGGTGNCGEGLVYRTSP